MLLEQNPASGAEAMSAEGDGGRGGARGKQESDHRSQTELGFWGAGGGDGRGVATYALGNYAHLLCRDTAWVLFINLSFQMSDLPRMFVCVRAKGHIWGCLLWLLLSLRRKKEMLSFFSPKLTKDRPVEHRAGFMDASKAAFLQPLPT